MSANIPEAVPSAAPQVAPSSPPVPKRITNAQTVCNEKNEKGKLCNGHLKQLRTAGEAAEVHLRGDDVLFKCQVDGTLYMGPPLGHVRDPQKQHRFVEAELSALLQAAGGTLPVIKKNDKGVYVIVEPEGAGHAHAPSAAKPAAKKESTTSSAPTPAPAKAAPVAEKPTAPPPGPKAEAQPDRNLNRRSTYAGVVDTGPVAGESKEQKIERLQKVVAGAKQRAEEGGAEPLAAVAAPSPVAEPEAQAMAAAPVAEEAKFAEVKAAPEPTAPNATSGQPDRTLMKRSTYAGVVDTGPVPGETHEQKIERLTKLAAAAKQRAEEGGS